MLKIVLIGKRREPRVKVSALLRRHHGFKQLRISEPVRKMMLTMYHNGMGRQSWELRMKYYDALYAINNDLHVDYLLKRVAVSQRDIVVDDVRYINELIKLQEAGFVVIRVEGLNKTRRPGKTLTKFSSPGTISLEEYFLDDKKVAYKVDYGLLYENAEKTKPTLEQIILDIKTKNSV